MYIRGFTLQYGCLNYFKEVLMQDKEFNFYVLKNNRNGICFWAFHSILSLIYYICFHKIILFCELTNSRKCFLPEKGLHRCRYVHCTVF